MAKGGLGKGFCSAPSPVGGWGFDHDGLLDLHYVITQCNLTLRNYCFLVPKIIFY